MKKRILSAILVLAMILSLAPATLAAETGFALDGALPEVSTEGPLQLPVDTLQESDDVNGTTEMNPADLESKYADHGVETFYNSDKAQRPSATDEVTFIVEMKAGSLLNAGYSANEIAAQTASVMSYQNKQIATLDALKERLNDSFGAEENFEINFTYTVATTGLSVTTQYGNKAAIEAMPGVEKVYVAPMFTLPNDQVSEEVNLTPSTSNSSTMIGADTLNASGYTGIGTRIAILDTGILLTHPNFEALPEEKLENPLTREEIEGVWDNLNASGTMLLPNAYYSTKIPYIFNYVTMDYNMDHMFAGSDHGTHVAGIAAGNKIDSSNMIGMAPDAQLVIMQVFNQGGGASWDTIMAALEDCIWLDVDAANLSLGSAAGFTDHNAESAMNKVLTAFENTDIEVLIASGNDTNNAYKNLWGGNMSLLENPDIGLAGTPSTYKSALAVASIDNDAIKSLYFSVDGEVIPFDDTASSTATKFFNNFRGKTLEFVMVPGTGDASDYEGLDVYGKVAVVSRGVLSFPEKQANAQTAGAIACVVYNNVNEKFMMQISDGEGHIPCISISKAAGELMKNSTSGEMTVCEEMAAVNIPASASDFSSWGVTPDLKLKPEIAGVGGQVYSSTDPQISGSFYSTWDGTSMATPQVAGAAAVVKEYFRENYPQFAQESGELRRAMANIMMSTAQIIMNGEVPYSPRHQGSGLVDLVGATTSKAYLSSRDTYETRPKGEMGDDPQRTGAFEFNFEINNFSNEDLTYTFDSSVLTETVVNEYFIGNTATALESRIEVYSMTSNDVMMYDFNNDGQITTADARALLRDINGVETVDAAHTEYRDVNGDGEVTKADVDVITSYCAGLEVEVDLLAMSEQAGTQAIESVTVPAGEMVALTARIQLTENDIAVVEQFPNGIYVEGFLYVNSADEDGVDMNMPFVGFYGDWSDAPIFDGVDEELGTSLYPMQIITSANTLLGTNPYFRNGKSGSQYNAVSHSLPIAAMEFGQLRNVLQMDFVVTDQETGEEYFRLEAENLAKTHYNASYGMIVPTWVESDNGEIWDGKDANGEYVPDGTKVTYSIIGYLDDGDDIADDTYSFDFTVDSQMPVVENEADLQSALRFEGDRTYLTLDLKDNHHIAAVIFMSPEGIIMGKYEVDNVPGETTSKEFEITGFGSEFMIVVADFALNEREVDVMLNLGDQNLAKPTPIELDKNRIYGSETFDGAAVEGGWFSANKTDFSNPRNETYDSVNRYYSAEYVNGYLVAQNASDGHLYLVTPSGTYWGIQLLAENRGTIGDPGVWVLYDMAMDYSGEKDKLYAVGWYYQGDQDNNGKDDGYNALFEITFGSAGNVNVNAVGRITGTKDSAEILTLGITTEGRAYGIDTNAKLYSLNLEPVLDESAGQWSGNVNVATYIGTTDFVNVQNYSGANVIQSMGYDHNDGVMYWYAHSQTPNGNTYINVDTVYSVNLTTGECTEVGSYGPGGQTSLFIPHDIESNLFEMDVQATGFSINPGTLAIVEGQTRRLNIDWEPWNAKPVAVTWDNKNPEIATVDKYGFVTTHKEGQAIITATAKIMGDYEWGWLPDGSWGIIAEPGLRDVTVECTVDVLPVQEELYSFVIADFKDFTTVNKWLTYSAKNPTVTTNLGGQKVQVQNQDGNMVETDAIWYGGAYYNGYVYTTLEDSYIENNEIHSGTALYRTKVTKGKTPAETIFGEPERIGFADGVTLTNLAFDYNTSRMYALENKALGGLGIVDLDNGTFDYLGTFSGDLLGPTYTTAMAVTADGTIVVADQGSNLYSVDPDTMETVNLYRSDVYAPYYAAMTYDYNTGCIYWNPCNTGKTSPLMMVLLGAQPGDTQVVEIGDVSTKYGVEQTVIFTIPEVEPEAKIIPVEGIEITNGDLTGLQGGTVQLNTVTTPLRPTSRTITWTSSNEDVVTVDTYGVMTYRGVGTATVTASTTNKDEATYGGPFTDSINVTVLESAGRFEAFLASDEGGSQYYDFWINFNDYAVDRAHAGQSMISILSIRTGTYYDGYYYAYNDRCEFLRINAKNPTDYKVLGTLDRDVTKIQITGMAVDYTTGVMYGLTLPANYDFSTWASTKQIGELVTIDLDTGAATKIADLDFNTPVFALACDDEGQLYAAGGTFDYFANTANIYKLNKETGALELYTTIDGAGVYTGPYYYGNHSYNTQMTYDFGTDRLYLNATVDHQNHANNAGFYMVQLGGEPVVTNLGDIALELRAGSTIKYGDVFLGLLSSIPEDSEIPVTQVNGIILNKTHGRVALGQTAQLTAQVRPSNAADPSLTWSSSNEDVATVSQNGLVTGLAEGETVITVRSNQTGIENTCVINVVEISGPQSTAYTVSAQKDALISFNPALPAQTAEEVASISGGGNIHGMAYGDDCLYYVQVANYQNYLYRYDFLTQESTYMTTLYAFSDISDIAYDAENNLLYAVAGFYMFQYDMSNLDPNFAYYSNYIMDQNTMTFAGVEVIDGAVYTLGTDLYSNTTMLAKYADKYLSGYTVVKEDLSIPVVHHKTDMAYDAHAGLFYLTDAGHTIYSMDANGENIATVDILGDGIDLNGLVIVPASEN